MKPGSVKRGTQHSAGRRVEPGERWVWFVISGVPWSRDGGLKSQKENVIKKVDDTWKVTEQSSPCGIHISSPKSSVLKFEMWSRHGDRCAREGTPVTQVKGHQRVDPQASSPKKYLFFFLGCLKFVFF